MRYILQEKRFEGLSIARQMCYVRMRGDGEDSHTARKEATKIDLHGNESRKYTIAFLFRGNGHYYMSINNLAIYNFNVGGLDHYQTAFYYIFILFESHVRLNTVSDRDVRNWEEVLHFHKIDDTNNASEGQYVRYATYLTKNQWILLPIRTLNTMDLKQRLIEIIELKYSK